MTYIYIYILYSYVHLYMHTLRVCVYICACVYELSIRTSVARPRQKIGELFEDLFGEFDVMLDTLGEFLGKYHDSMYPHYITIRAKVI